MALLVVACSFGIPGYHLGLGLIGLGLMAANVLGAVAPLHIFNSANPIHIYLVSLIVRMVLVALFMLGLILRGPHTRIELASFLLTAMLSFIAFQVIEIRHLTRHQQALFQRGNAA